MEEIIYCMKPRWTWAPLGIPVTLSDRQLSPRPPIPMQLTRSEKLVPMVGGEISLHVWILSKKDVGSLDRSSLTNQRELQKANGDVYRR